MAMVSIACSPHVPVRQSSPQPVYPIYQEKTITSNLFSDSAAQLSEADVATLLDGEIDYASDIRIAVFYYAIRSRNFGKWGYNYASSSAPELQEDYISRIRKEMTATGQVSRVSLIPSLLISSDANITQLREAAARMQCDMVFIIKAESDIYRDSKLFKKDEIKAYATCEALLMDTRTTVVPFSDIISTEAVFTRAEDDSDLAETQKKAEQAAISEAIEKAARASAVFINEVKQAD
ncbi:hypothetical protein AB9P05_15005 [Roseivirga sp. BDSF3-8]|uniref:hypothetical protein n=1 Tax=Roseivirga sp. BDSF3-8 TaxID=3241598 RepID=UPI0035320344